MFILDAQALRLEREITEKPVTLEFSIDDPYDSVFINIVVSLHQYIPYSASKPIWLKWSIL